MESYLKELSPNVLPIKGSTAAQERKQMLQKQLPLHDIDPALCDTLTENEIKQMKDYIDHIKENSAGVGSVIKLSAFVKNYQPSNLVASRTNSQLPKSETVVLQGFDRTNALKNRKNLSHLQPTVDLKNRVVVENRTPQNFGITNLNPVSEIRNQGVLPNYLPGNYVAESIQRPLEGLKISDILADTKVNADAKGQNFALPGFDNQNFDDLGKIGESGIAPHYARGKYDVFCEERTPKTFGRIKDLAYSTHAYDDDNNQFLDNKNVANEPLNNYAPKQLDVYENIQNPAVFNPLAHNAYNFEQLKAQAPNPQNTNFLNNYEPQQLNIYENLQNPTALKTPNFPLHQNPHNPKFLNNYTPQQLSIHENIQNPIGSNPSAFIPYNSEKLKVPENLRNPVNAFDVSENQQNPSHIQIGAINDLEYAVTQLCSPETHENEVLQPEIPRKDVKHDLSKFPSCHRCKKLFDEHAVVVGIDRNASLWHASCFKCNGCNQNLADLMYFYDKEGDDIYCLRDFAKIRGIQRCQACDELIFVKEYCLAENSTFHVKHFCCFECDEPLAGQNYVMEDSQPLCLSCFEKLKAESCAACKKPIKPDEKGANLGETHFHANDSCFVCKICAKPLLGAKLLFKNGCLYCSANCFGVDKK